MKKRVISGLLLILLLCSFTLPAMAADVLPEDIPQIYLRSDRGSAQAGESFTLTLGLDRAMSELGAFSVKLWFDPACVELVSSQRGSASAYARLGARAREENGRSRWLVNVFNAGQSFSMAAAPIYELSFRALTDTSENLMELFTLTVVTVQGEDSEDIAVAIGEAPPEISYTLGDVNGDGAINTADVLRILRYYNEEIDLSNSELTAADVNADSEINTADALRILRYYNEEIMSLN